MKNVALIVSWPLLAVGAGVAVTLVLVAAWPLCIQQRTLAELYDMRSVLK